MNTRFPASEIGASGMNGTIGRNRIAPASASGADEQNARGDVRAVREPRRDDLARVEVVVGGRRPNERDEILRSRVKVRDVENPFGQAAEKPRRAILRDGAARTDETRVGREHLAELNEVVLVATGAMEQQQRAASSPWGAR